MGAYELCIIVATLLIIVTFGNIMVSIARGRKKQENVVQEVVAQPVNTVEPVVVMPVEVSTEVEDSEVVAETQIEETPSDESSYIITALESGNVEETDSGVIVYNTDGTAVYYSYNKSFKSKLIQAKDEVREYYNLLKNYVASYKKVKTSISWGQESIRYGKEKVCWFVLRGKSLYLYLPLNPDDFAESKYKVERSKAKRYDELPCMYKITNKRRVQYATELIALVMEKFDSEFVEKTIEDYTADYPYEPTVELIKRNLIKVRKSNRAFAASKKEI